MTPPLCQLCNKRESSFFYSDQRREFWQCQVCKLVFVLPRYYVSAEEERRLYDLHENNESDAGYRRFLARLAAPLMQRLLPNACGLDFGSGPSPVLAQMFRSAGYDIKIYDVFYARDESVWSNQFDFISATEVLEHLHAPGTELHRLWDHLEDGGNLAVMTKLVIDRDAFADWHYKNDPTHVCFFSRDTFLWWAEKYKAKIEFIGSDVIILNKQLFCAE